MLQRVQSEGLSRKRFGTSLPGGQSPRYRARAVRDRAAGIAVHAETHRVFQASDHSVEHRVCGSVFLVCGGNSRGSPCPAYCGILAHGGEELVSRER